MISILGYDNGGFDENYAVFSMSSDSDEPSFFRESYFVSAEMAVHMRESLLKANPDVVYVILKRTDL